MRNLLGILFPLVALVVAVSSCNTTGCTENQSSIPLAGFYASTDGSPVAIQSVAIGGVGAPDDSLLVSPSSRVSDVYLPFRSSQSSTSFFFRYEQEGIQGIEDVITFTYESVPFLASEECGAMYQYHITDCSYTNFLIDHVEITDSVITNADVQKIKIFFRTAE